MSAGWTRGELLTRGAMAALAAGVALSFLSAGESFAAGLTPEAASRPA